MIAPIAGEEIDDMTQLSELTENAIMINLQRRYSKKKIYVRIIFFF